MAAFKIDRQAIAKMQRELQREFDKRPISIPVRADPPPTTAGGSGHVTVHYEGPVVHITGNHTQVAWTDSGSIHQQAEERQVAPGFEALAQTVADILASIGDRGLGDTDIADARAAGDAVLRAVTASDPDPSLARRAGNTLRGLLAPIAMGLSVGAADGATEWAHTAVGQLTQALPG